MKVHKPRLLNYVDTPYDHIVNACGRMPPQENEMLSDLFLVQTCCYLFFSYWQTKSEYAHYCGDKQQTTAFELTCS